MDIPRLQKRLECFVFKREYEDKAAELRADIKRINDACRRIANSKRLKQLLQVNIAQINS